MSSQNTSGTVQGPTFQDFSQTLERTRPQIGSLGGRKYSYGTILESLHGLVSKCIAIAKRTNPGAVSTEEIETLKGRISDLNTQGEEELQKSGKVQKILTYLRRIGNIRFLFKSPVERAENALSSLKEQTSSLLNNIVTALNKESLPSNIQDLCNQITSPKLYEELIAKIIKESPPEKRLDLLTKLPLPSTGTATCQALLDKAKAIVAPYNEIIRALSQSPMPTKDQIANLVNGFHLTGDQKTMLGSILIKNYFSMETFSLKGDFNLRDAIKDKLQLNSLFNVILLSSGRDAIRSLSQFKEPMMKHFFAMAEGLIKEYNETKSEDLFDLLSNLHNYYLNTVSVLCPEELSSEKSPWNSIQKKFNEILESFFSKKQHLAQTHPFTHFDSPTQLSEAVSLPNKPAINNWLSSLQEGALIVNDFSRQLPTGVSIGHANPLTTTVLKQRLTEIPQNDQDQKIVLCWKLFQEMSAYFREKKVTNPEQVASSLLTVATQAHPSFNTFIQLASFADHPLVPSTDPRKYTFFYDKETSTPCVTIEHGYTDGTRQFLVSDTIRVQEDKGTFTEEITCTPAPG